LFIHSNDADTKKSYFVEWKAIGITDTTLITRKEEYTDIITERPVNFDSTTFAITEEFVSTMGYEIVFTP
jgi:hypothetical protein